MTDTYAVDSKGGEIPVTLIYKTIHSHSLDQNDYETQHAIGVVINGRGVMFEDFIDVQQFIHPESGELYIVD